MYDIAQQLMYVIIAIIVIVACWFMINYFLPDGTSSNNLFSYPQTHSRKIQNMTSDEKRIVNENLEELVNIMATVPSAIINHLRVKGIFNDDQHEDLNQISSSKSQAQQIIAILKVQDHGKTGIKEALHVCMSSSVYNRMFGELEINHFSTPPPVSHMRPRMRFLFNRVISDFGEQLKRWYLASYTSDSSIDPRNTKMVADIFVPLIWKDDLYPNREITYKDVPLLLLRDTILTGRVAVVSGEAGMGKTTFVKKLCYDWASSRKWMIFRPFKLVIAIPLRHISRMHKCGTIADVAILYYSAYCASWFPSLASEQANLIRSFCEAYAEDILYIIDGLDEYDGGNIQIDMLKREYQMDQNFRSALIVTTRPTMIGIAKQRYELSVEGFTPAQISCFVEKWVNVEKKPDELILQLNQNNRMVLAKTPLLLQMMCDIWEWKQSLPSSQRQLFDDFIRYLNRKAKKERDPELDESEKHVLIVAGEVAFNELMSRRGGNLIIKSSYFGTSLPYLLNVGLVSVHDQLEYGQFAGALEKYVSFKHKTFQEYLAAVYFEHMQADKNTRGRTKISNRSMVVEFMGICAFVTDNHALQDVQIGEYIDEQNPDEWCAFARSLPSISIHICQNNFSEPTSKAGINRIVICNIDLDTANNLRSWISCNSISSSGRIVINALHVQDSEDGFKSLQSVLEVMVEVTNVEQLYIFLPLHCVSQRLSSHNANINFDQCVQSIQAKYKRVIINGSQSTSTTVVYQDIQNGYLLIFIW